ncbi:hypothetical protein [Bacillus chungangensis]|uniref:Phage protein n=1 Tax=Bacillus chungangensis TaxID=587633 RepID=A0ABT9WM72_9BACI|nr:hypothetical protein [Bacillus chungangensis]MDQ0174383.1 hypothetical protein [Bacillus chungangensis]
MAKFKATPFYSVRYGDKSLTFGLDGIYETEDDGEIRALMELCPRYLTCLEKAEKLKTEEKSEPAEKPKATKPKPKPKASAKK